MKTKEEDARDALGKHAAALGEPGFYGLDTAHFRNAWDYGPGTVIRGQASNEVVIDYEPDGR